MDLLLASFFWFVMAIVFACLEIEAEGKYGWAEKMPTWYRTTGKVARIYGLIMGGKPLTGYHSFTFFLPIMLFHSHFIQGIEWTVQGELLSWALFYAWCPMWDFLWFVLNPHYTVKNFRQENVWWHAGSYWIMNRIPMDYVLGWSVSIILTLSACLVEEQNWSLMADHLLRLAYFTGLTLLLIIISPLYHRWHAHMREADDREKAPISHRLRR